MSAEPSDREQQLFDLLSTVQDAYADLREENYRLKDTIKTYDKELAKRAAVDMFDGMINALRCVATDPGAAKNYVEISFKWDEALAPELPFKHVSVVFRRPGAKSPGELVKEALEARDAACDLVEDLLQGSFVSREELERLRTTPDANYGVGLP